MADILIDSAGIAHLPGSTLNTFETACGHCDSGEMFTEAKGPITCRGCVDALLTILRATTPAERRALASRT